MRQNYFKAAVILLGVMSALFGMTSQASCADPTVTLVAASQVPGKLQISAIGTYNVPAGDTLVKIIAYAIDANGNIYASPPAKLGPGTAWSATINVPNANTYVVYVILYTTPPPPPNPPSEWTNPLAQNQTVTVTNPPPP